MKILFIIFLIALSLGAKDDIYAEELKIAISSGPTNLNPFYSTDGNSQNILRLAHTSLIDFDLKMKPICVLCKNFKEWKQNSRHHIQFQIKKNIQFSDGKPVTAIDIQNSIKYYTDDKKIKSIFRNIFSKIVRVIVHDPYSIEIIYKNFDLSNLTNLALLKVLKIKKFNLLKKITNKDIVGAGNYHFFKINDLSIELRPKNVEKPKLKFVVVKDETTLALKIIGGEIDLSLANMSPRKMSWLRIKEGRNLNFHETLGSNYKYLSINHKNDFLKDINIRKAIFHLIPKDKIIKYKLKSTVVNSTGIFSQAFGPYYRKLKIANYNPQLAESLLKQSGYVKNKDNFFEKKGKEISFTVTTTSNKSSLEIATIISNYLIQGGIRVKVQNLEWGSFMRFIKTGGFDMALGQWIGFAGPEMLKSIFHSKSIPPVGLNRGRYRNEEFDKYIDLSVNSIDKKERLKNYHLAMDIVDDDIPYINLWHPNIIWIARKCIILDKVYPNGSYLALLEIETNCGRKKI